MRSYSQLLHGLDIFPRSPCGLLVWIIKFVAVEIPAVVSIMFHI